MIDTPEFIMPEHFSFEAFISISTYETTYGYTVHVAGDDASITSHLLDDGDPDEEDGTLYFRLDLACDEQTSYSFMTAKFQVWDVSTPEKADTMGKRLCWKAPPGYEINEALPVDHTRIIQMFHAIQDWEYAFGFMTTEGPVQLYKRPSDDTFELQVVDGKPLKYKKFIDLGYYDGEVEVIIDFKSFDIYSSPEEVPKAVLSDEEKQECGPMRPDTPNVALCEGIPDDKAEETAQKLLIESLNTKSLGLVDDFSHVGGGGAFPSTGEDYKMLGSAEEQDKIMKLKSFVPGMVGRPQLRVRAQGNCAACYSFGTIHTIISSYLHMNPDKDPKLEFSNQQIMNCLPLQQRVVKDKESGEVVSTIEDGYIEFGSGCWGGDQNKTIDWLVHAAGSKLPLLETVPYIGFQGGCDMTVDGIETGITGYLRVTTVEEMKNALVFRGDVAGAFDVNDDFRSFSYSDKSEITWPRDDEDIHENAYLGKGYSGEYPGTLNHVVGVIGWGPCQVDHCKTQETIEAECWIVQNSHGKNRGINRGFDLVHNDPECDLGMVSSLDALIPLYEINNVAPMDEKNAETVNSATNKHRIGVIGALGVALVLFTV